MIRDLFDLKQLPSTSLIALGLHLEHEIEGNPRLVEALRPFFRGLVEQAQAANDLRERWMERRAVDLGRGLATDVGARNLSLLDQRVDVALGQVYRGLEGVAIRSGPDSVAGAAAVRLLSTLFPAGLAAHVRAEFAEQVVHNLRVATELSKAAVQADLNAVSMVEEVGRLRLTIEDFLEEWEAQQEGDPSVATSWPHVREAERSTHTQLCRLVAAIITHAEGADQEHLLRIVLEAQVGGHAPSP
jgi:hypothetical protein